MNKELGKDHKNHGFHSLNISGRSNTNHQIIASAFNKHFTSIPTMISQNINASNCFTKTCVNNQNNLSLSLNNVIHSHFLVLHTTVPPLRKLRI